MKEPTWVLDEVALAIHSILLAEHGGESGIRNSSMLDSALARARQKFNYEPNSSIFELAAAYSFGIAKNHPFVDGNKRTAFTTGALFLEMNGYVLDASEVDAAITFESLAVGNVGEDAHVEWFRENSKKA